MSTTAPVEDGIPVKLPSGNDFRVLTLDEVKFLRGKITQYSKQFKLANISDLSDMDRLVTMEMLSHRYGLFLSLGKDYYGEPIINEIAWQGKLNDLSGEIRQLKKTLRLDRASRNQDDETDMVRTLADLRMRAKVFGVHREKQLDKALELANLAIAMVQLYQNSNESDRKEMKVTPQDIVDWLWNYFKPEFQAVDEHFRKNIQRYWFVATGEGL